MANNFLPQIIEDPAQIQTEINKIGAEPYAVGIMSPKGNFKAIKLKRVRPIAANIIKQEILARGGEAVLAYGALNHSIDETDVLLLGTLTQIESLAAKLRLHQFGLKDLAEDIEVALDYYQNSPAPIKIGSKTFEFGRRTYIMGILNVTPDSFSDGGKFIEPGAAIKHALQMAADGADIIDIGGESTRPGSDPISIEEEKKRVIPIIKELAKNPETVISIDTYKSEVAAAAIDAGANLVNDISGLRFDPKMAGMIAEKKVPLVVMHIQGSPKSMQQNPSYSDLVSEILEYLKASLEIAVSAGILESNIIIDPGIGFGKTAEHNLEILRRLKEFKSLGRPILVGTSRKSFIGKVLNLSETERMEGTAATAALAISSGADIIRVHDVREMVRVARMSDAVCRGGVV